MSLAASVWKSKSMNCLHNSEDATANVIECHLHRCYQTKQLHCSIFSHDCLAFSGKWLFSQIAHLSKVRWAYYKHSYNQHHTLHPNDHQSALALMHLNEYSICSLILSCPMWEYLWLSRWKQNVDSAHWAEHFKIVKSKSVFTWTAYASQRHCH